MALNIMLVLECKTPRRKPALELFGWGPDAAGLHRLGMLSSGAQILHD